MIPKTIHYCWFGGNALPKDALKCIESWKKFCPSYEIKQWDESNIDFSDCPYAIEAYNAKKWAFVSDYARFKILYEHGGLYFDTDVELIKSIQHIVLKGPFMGCENASGQNNLGVNPGIGLGAESGMDLYREILDFYKSIHFEINDSNKYKTVVEYTTELLKKYHLKDVNDIQCIKGVFVYPKEYFQPMNRSTGKISIDERTVSIHHYSGSWLNKKNKRRGQIYKFIKRFFGRRLAEFIRGQMKNSGLS